MGGKYLGYKHLENDFFSERLELNFVKFLHIFFPPLIVFVVHGALHSVIYF